ncbi:MAG: hypothetical protein K2X27_14660 [Candidatus Obscuribacterales bacterium]|nr:hypothetical protein [Candidatus Obscuribacterales bacterium]
MAGLIELIKTGLEEMEAEKLHQSELTLAKAMKLCTTEEDRQEVLRCLLKLAGKYLRQNELDKPETLYDYLEKTDVSERTRVMEWLARLHHQKGDLRSAEEIYTGIFEQRARFLGPEHSDAVGALKTAALLRQMQGKSVEELYIWAYSVKKDPDLAVSVEAAMPSAASAVGLASSPQDSVVQAAQAAQALQAAQAAQAAQAVLDAQAELEAEQAQELGAAQTAGTTAETKTEAAVSEAVQAPAASSPEPSVWSSANYSALDTDMSGKREPVIRTVPPQKAADASHVDISTAPAASATPAQPPAPAAAQVGAVSSAPSQQPMRGPNSIAAVRRRAAEVTCELDAIKPEQLKAAQERTVPVPPLLAPEPAAKDNAVAAGPLAAPQSKQAGAFVKPDLSAAAANAEAVPTAKAEAASPAKAETTPPANSESVSPAKAESAAPAKAESAPPAGADGKKSSKKNSTLYMLDELIGPSKAPEIAPLEDEIQSEFVAPPLTIESSFQEILSGWESYCSELTKQLVKLLQQNQAAAYRQTLVLVSGMLAERSSVSQIDFERPFDKSSRSKESLDLDWTILKELSAVYSSFDGSPETYPFEVALLYATLRRAFSLGPLHVDTIDSLCRLSHIYAHEIFGCLNLNFASTGLRIAALAYKKHPHVTDMARIRCLSKLAQVLIELGEYKEAKSTLKEAAVLADNCPEIARAELIGILKLLADCTCKAEDFETAAGVYERIRNIQEAVSRDVDLFETFVALVITYKKAGNATQSQAYLQRLQWELDWLENAGSIRESVAARAEEMEDFQLAESMLNEIMATTKPFEALAGRAAQALIRIYDKTGREEIAAKLRDPLRSK